jgi:hypothetical protein
MFKKTQEYLLLNRPLLWNLKVLPMAAIMLVIHIVFFVAGYAYGAIDFSETNEKFFFDWTEGFAMFFGVVVSILLGLVWLVFYFRNNAFKSFYPKKKSSLYQEWLLIFAILTLNVTYPLSFIYAKDLRARNYYDETEVMRRTDVISMVSLFADGAYIESGDSLIDGKDGESINIHRDTFKYGTRYYPLKSLLNKNITSFSIQQHDKDSLNKRRVKGWLVANKKDSVLWLMNQFDKIAKEHQAISNITPAKWISLVYHHPDFADYITVGRMPFFVENESTLPYEENIEVMAADGEGVATSAVKDTASNIIKVRNGTTYIYPKYYVPLRQIENSYQIISTAWTSPDAEFDLVLAFVYIGLILSLLVFSFRLTSGRSWLIAIVSFGVTAMLIGIINLLLFKLVLRELHVSRFDDEMYFGLWLVIVLSALGYFLSIKHTRRLSDIILNILLWLMPWVLPAIAMLLNSYFNSKVVYVNQVRVNPRSWLEILVDDYMPFYMAGSVLAYIIFMYFFTSYIKKWKGIAEA